MKLNKLFAGVLAAAMMMSIGVSAMAATPQDGDVTITKKYTVTNNGTSTVAETFTFKITPGENVPELKPNTDTKTVSFDALSATSDNYSTTGTFGINMNDLQITKPGTYVYTLTETASSNAGVTTSAPITMTVQAYYAKNEDVTLSYKTVFHKGSDKVDEIENVYNAGELNLTKTVTGANGDRNEEFKFTITLTGESDKTYQNLTVETSLREGTTNTNTNPSTITVGTATDFYLKHGDSLSIKNLPYGVTYQIVETKANTEGYETTITGNPEDLKIKAATTNVTFTNNKGGQIVDTGVVLDNAPYIVMLAVVAAGAVVMVSKKRREE